MGCMSSREARLDRRRSLPSHGRSLSIPAVHGSRRKGDSLHVVSLTFSTLGSLRLDPNQDSFDQEMMATNDRDRKSPKPAAAGHVDPPEPESETINAWELMEGLDEYDSPLLPLQPSLADRSFSFAGTSPEPLPAKSKSSLTSAAGSPNPFWMHTDQLDPEVISNFRKAMTELSPQHPTLRRRRLSPVKYRPDEIPKFPGIVKARVDAFEEKIDARRRSFKSTTSLKIPPLEKTPPAGKGKLVLYSTGLRAVRKTHEDCWNAKVILQSYGVRIDERDVSLHGGFREELSEILGAGTKLPKIFADGRYLGGAEEVERMHENGELSEALKDCEMAVALKGSNGVACEGCVDYRFQPCEICSGSCKVFVEEEEDEIAGFRRCVNCNENGLVRCPLCS